MSSDDSDMIPLAQQRTRTFDRATLILSTTPNGPQRWPKVAQAGKAFKVWHLKTCLSCGAVVPVGPAGELPEGGLPCGH